MTLDTGNGVVSASGRRRRLRVFTAISELPHVQITGIALPLASGR
jgi:hypothetical protein